MANNLSFDDCDLDSRTLQMGIFVSQQNTSNLQDSDNLSFKNSLTQEIKSISLNQHMKIIKKIATPKSGHRKIGYTEYNSKLMTNDYSGWNCIESGISGNGKQRKFF
jgi:hypothetical protein